MKTDPGWYRRHELTHKQAWVRVNRRLADAGLPPLSESTLRSIKQRKQHDFPPADGHLDATSPGDEAGREVWLAKTIDRWVDHYIFTVHGQRLLDLAKRHAEDADQE